eukprot:TRINITY_DN1908_c0_g1_i5.p1 TRINITY_DN1908_c0_g1~~TRINITY_DN1908_c0_g1_i5.p1  ORF type:complete len:238 (-),score=52.42 TRINITY_DN1908_c0_g1_i5:48-761(-)
MLKLQASATAVPVPGAAQQPPSLATAQQEKEKERDRLGLEAVAKDFRDKLAMANAKQNDQRNQIHALKQECKALKRALTKEVGEDVPITKILEDQASGGWRGRAEQITFLKAKLNEAQPSGPARHNRIDDMHREVIDLKAAERRQEFERICTENAEVQQELAGIRKKLGAAATRNKILESELHNMRDKLRIVLDKTSSDDRLIDMLREELWRVSPQSLGHPPLAGSVSATPREASHH